VLKNLALLFLVLTLALWGGSCARTRGLVPEVVLPEEQPICDVPHLQQELAEYEEELTRADEERNNCLIRLARLSFTLGELCSKDEKLPYFEKGRRYSEILAQEQPSWPEGHYWLALNLGGLAEQGGARRGLKMVPEIVAEMEKALKDNPAYDQAGPHRVLGRIYFECPQWPLSVGNLPESLSHLQAAVAIAPENSTNHLFLAEALFRAGKKEEARQELEEVLKATRHSLCAQFLEEDRQTAQRLLQKK
jgi:tetratricopeptide (TPR) repeat protein